MMYTNKNGDKIQTRATALYMLARGANPDEFSDHPNYHVRVAAFKAAGGRLPEEPSDSILNLFKGLCPNIYDRCIKQIESDKGKENPLPIENYAEKYAATNALARQFLTRLDVCWLLASK